jgi:outer membrane protein assembly factor BamB
VIRVRVAAVLVAVAACAPERPRPEARGPIAYPARPAAWPVPPWTGVIGRGPAPLPLVAESIGGAPPALRADALWAVPGTGPARAVVSGRGDAGAVAVDAIEVDAGVVRWRSSACPGPVVAVTAESVVCASAERIVGLDSAGAAGWQIDGRFVAASGDLILAATADGAVVLDATAGTEAARFALPGGVSPASLVAACRRDGAVDVWTWASGALTRLDVRGASATAAWSAPIATSAGAMPRVDACDDAVVVTAPLDGAEELHAVARRDGRVLGGPVRARGAWPARTGEGLGLELATDDGLERRGRDLGAATRLGGERLGRLVALRGARRLVEGEGGMVLLGDGAPRALAGPGAGARVVLGDRHAVSLTASGHLVQRWRLSEAAAPLPPRAAAPDERALARYPDLPAPAPPPARIDLPDAGVSGVAAVAVDGSDAALVYTAPVEPASAGLALFDVRARRWRWHAPEACLSARVIGIAAADGVVVCASPEGVRAVARADGAPRWRWSGDLGDVTAVRAAAGVVAVAVGNELAVLDAATGREIDRVADSRGGSPRFALAQVGGEALLIGAERGGVVARAPRLGMLPRWALRVDGAVSDVHTAGDRAAIALATGELYLVDIATGGAVIAAGDFGAGWRAPGGGDLVVREETGDDWRIAAFGLDGIARFRSGITEAGPWHLADARGRDPRAPLVLIAGPRALALDPATGVVTRLVEAGGAHLSFGTALDGAPVAGLLFAQPLAIALF